MSENINLDSYKHIWTTDFNDYVLLKSDYGGQDTYVIYYRPNQTMLIIEDDIEYKAVKEKMMEMGIKIAHVDEID